MARAGALRRGLARAVARLARRLEDVAAGLGAVAAGLASAAGELTPEEAWREHVARGGGADWEEFGVGAHVSAALPEPDAGRGDPSGPRREPGEEAGAGRATHPSPHASPMRRVTAVPPARAGGATGAGGARDARDDARVRPVWADAPAGRAPAGTDRAGKPRLRPLPDDGAVTEERLGAASPGSASPWAGGASGAAPASRAERPGPSSRPASGQAATTPDGTSSPQPAAGGRGVGAAANGGHGRSRPGRPDLVARGPHGTTPPWDGSEPRDRRAWPEGDDGLAAPDAVTAAPGAGAWTATVPDGSRFPAAVRRRDDAGAAQDLARELRERLRRERLAREQRGEAWNESRS